MKTSIEFIYVRTDFCDNLIVNFVLLCVFDIIIYECFIALCFGRRYGGAGDVLASRAGRFANQVRCCALAIDSSARAYSVDDDNADIARLV